MLNPTEQVIREILLNQIDIEENNIWIASQNKKIPNSNDLFIIVSMRDTMPISNTNKVEYFDVVDEETKEVKTLMKEIQTVNVLENIAVEIISVDNKALLKRWEVLTAMGSIFAQQKQEEYCFKIGKITSSFANTSETEGGSELNKFTLIIPCFVWYKKEIIPTTNDYYDKFSTRVDDEKTIDEENGLFEFTIEREE